MRIEMAAKRFAETEEEHSGWMNYLRESADAYDEFRLNSPVALNFSGARGRKRGNHPI